jgi:hypothetical protein
MIEERISKQELEKLYSVDRATIEAWVKNYGLPMIKINSHSKFVRISDLIDWESEMIVNNKLMDKITVDG